MEQLIPVVNKLQDVFGAIGSQDIDLPQIVVVGSQSSGKSSVLENVVGRDFLPRGSGIVTRRPLVLQLYSLATPDSDVPRVDKSRGEEWGEFLHLPGQRFYDFADIRTEIARETDRLTGKNKGISNKSINLKIFSPHVLNLTLVDLPGITKVPTGDQPEDVEEQIRNMCLEFIKNPNAIILAVTAANQDLVNSDGLKMARSVDPEGERTVGVLTKVDIMDAGTDCSDVLANKVIPLKRGYVAVVNRSQKDIAEGVPIRQGLAKESAFFKSHPKYRSHPARCGTTNLARTLNQILMHHIRDCLPDIKSRVSKMMVETVTALEALGNAGDSQTALGGTLLRIISSFAANVNASIEGRATVDGGIEMSELYGGARLSFIFNEIFGRLLAGMEPLGDLTDEDIRTAIANANGTRPSLFVPEISFDLLVRKQISRLEAPGLQCVDMIYDELHRLARQCETPELGRFPALRDHVMEIVEGMLRRCVKPTQQMISDLIRVELAYINTSHPDFIGGKQALAQVTKKPSHAQGLEAPTGSNITNDVVNPGPSSSSSTANTTAANANSNPPAPPQSPIPTNLSQFVDKTNGTNQNQGQNQGTGFFGMFRPQITPNGSNNTSSSLSDSPRANESHINGNTAYPPLGNVTVRNRNSARTPVPNRHQESSDTLSSNNYGLIKLPQMPEKMRVTAGTNDWGRREVEVIKTLVTSYFNVVRKGFIDLVPKMVMHFLVNGFRETLQNELVAQLYRDSLMQELMRETEDVAIRRKTCTEMRDLLQRALDIIGEVRDFRPNL